MPTQARPKMGIGRRAGIAPMSASGGKRSQAPSSLGHLTHKTDVPFSQRMRWSRSPTADNEARNHDPSASVYRENEISGNARIVLLLWAITAALIVTPASADQADGAEPPAEGSSAQIWSSDQFVLHSEIVGRDFLIQVGKSLQPQAGRSPAVYRLGDVEPGGGSAYDAA